MYTTAFCRHITSLPRYQRVASFTSSVTMNLAEMTHTAQAKVVTDIIKSQNDDRSHRGLVLDNGLKVCNVGTCFTSENNVPGRREK